MAELKNFFGADAGLDTKSVEMLIGALERSNLPGFDYIEYKQALAKLSSMGIDEATAQKSAFATASTMGLTKEKLLGSAQHYREVIAKEKTQFDQALQKQQDQRIAAKLKEIHTLKTTIATAEEQIKQLQSDIADAQMTIRDNDSSIEKEVEKLNATKLSFEHAHQSILNQMDLDIKRIETVL